MLPKAVQSIWNGLTIRGIIPEIKGLEYIIVVIAIGLIAVASKQTGRKDGIKPMYNNLLSNLWDD